MAKIKGLKLRDLRNIFKYITGNKIINRISKRTILTGLLFYIGIVLIFAIFYKLTGEIKINNGSKSPASLFDNFYFSFITFATIGFGDIVPTGYVSKMLVFLETVLSALYVPVFGGYLFYEFLKRPKNILFPDNLFIRHTKNNIVLSARLGNAGAPTIQNISEIEFCEVRGQTRHTKEKYVQETPVFEYTWFVQFVLNGGNNKLLEALKYVLQKENSSFIRVVFSAHDTETGQPVYHFQDYPKNAIKYGEKYLDVVYYEGIKKSQPNWNNFNKIENMSEDHKIEVEKLLK